MANTYTKLNIHAVFSVHGRENLLLKNLRPKLFGYISGILENLDQYPLSVNGYQDHVHLFFELKPVSSVSEILKIVKSNSSRWINENKFIKGKFSWQEGYGAFSHSYSQRNEIIQYILKQEEHHKKNTFREEYLSILKNSDIDYDSNYLFEFYD